MPNKVWSEITYPFIFSFVIFISIFHNIARYTNAWQDKDDMQFD